jgi:hypothetical protein
MTELLLRNRLKSKKDQDVFPPSYMPCTQLAINEKKDGEQKIINPSASYSITALIFITCLLLPRKPKKRKHAKNSKSERKDNGQDSGIIKLFLPFYLLYYINLHENDFTNEEI